MIEGPDVTIHCDYAISNFISVVQGNAQEILRLRQKRKLNKENFAFVYDSLIMHTLYLLDYKGRITFLHDLHEVIEGHATRCEQRRDFLDRVLKRGLYSRYQES